MLGYPGASCGKAVPPTENDCTFSCFWRVPLPRASAESLSALSDGTSTESVVPRNHGPPSRQIHRVGCLKLFEMWEGKRPYLVLPRWALFCFVFMEHITGVSSVSSCTHASPHMHTEHIRARCTFVSPNPATLAGGPHFPPIPRHSNFPPDRALPHVIREGERSVITGMGHTTTIRYTAPKRSNVALVLRSKPSTHSKLLGYSTPQTSATCCPTSPPPEIIYLAGRPS